MASKESRQSSTSKCKKNGVRMDWKMTQQRKNRRLHTAMARVWRNPHFLLSHKIQNEKNKTKSLNFPLCMIKSQINSIQQNFETVSGSQIFILSYILFFYMRVGYYCQTLFLLGLHVLNELHFDHLIYVKLIK